MLVSAHPGRRPWIGRRPRHGREFRAEGSWRYAAPRRLWCSNEPRARVFENNCTGHPSVHRKLESQIKQGRPMFLRLRLFAVLAFVAIGFFSVGCGEGTTAPVAATPVPIPTSLPIAGTSPTPADTSIPLVSTVAPTVAPKVTPTHAPTRARTPAPKPDPAAAATLDGSADVQEPGLSRSHQPCPTGHRK